MKIQVIEDDNIFIVKRQNRTPTSSSRVFIITYTNEFYNKDDLLNILMNDLSLDREKINEIIWELQYEYIRISRKDKYNRYISICEDINYVLKELVKHINYNNAKAILDYFDKLD